MFDPKTKSISFIEASGEHTEILSDCRITQVNSKERPADVPYMSDDGKVVLAGNLKIQLEMCLVQDLFLHVEDKVSLRIRLDIDRPSALGDYNPAARLKMISRHGRAFKTIGTHVVNGYADVIDIGIAPEDLAHHKPDTNSGNALVNIIFEEDDTPQTPIKINRITVSTEKAIKYEVTPDSEGPKTLRVVRK